MKNLNTALNMFDGCFCINLDSRADRWEYQQAQFSRFEVQDIIKRLSAVNPREKYGNTERDVKDRLNFSRLGQIGCTLSHLKAIKHAKDSGWKHVCVFEDDATFLDEGVEHAHKSVRDLFNQPWEVFYFGATYRSPMSRITDNLLRVNGGAYATHAICYSESFFDKILSSIPDNPLDILEIDTLDGEVVTIDTWLPRLLHPALTFASDPLVAIQRDDYSDISVRECPGMASMQLGFFNKWRPQ